MSRTGTELITLGLASLGGRTGGQFGDMSATQASIYSLNNILLDLAKDTSVPELEASYSVTLTSSAYEYTLPEATNNIRIKRLLAIRALRTGDTYDYPLTQMPALHTYARAVTPTSEHLGIPSFYRLFNRKLQVFPWPDTTYVLTLYCHIWPTEYTASNLGNVQPYGVEWDAPIQYGISAELYHLLQQVEEAAAWQGKYENAKRQVVESVRKTGMTLDGSLKTRRSRLDDAAYVDHNEITHTYLNLDTGTYVNV